MDKSDIRSERYLLAINAHCIWLIFNSGVHQQMAYDIIGVQTTYFRGWDSSKDWVCGVGLGKTMS